MKSYSSKFIVAMVVIATTSMSAFAQNNPYPVWTAFNQSDTESYNALRTATQPNVKPKKSTIFSLNPARFEAIIQNSPVERLDLEINLRPAPAIIMLPMPDGTQAAFQYVESSIMHPDLAAQFPQIRTYVGQGIDDPSATLRFDWTPLGFHAQILSPKGAIYVDPYYEDDDLYASYYKRDAVKENTNFQCLVESSPQTRTTNSSEGLISTRSGSELRTYRLALAATAEYTAVFGNATNALAAMTTTINRVTGVYETELSIRLELVANTSLLIYSGDVNADPYTNDDGGAMLSENIANVNTVIGSANYDIGHVFSTGGGGVAYLGSVCNTLKAGGVTGLSNPTGDNFDIDYVSHEMGHQFGGNHTFNGTVGSCSGGNRNGSTAYEPGSGSTIQAYAGICGSDNLQAHSDPNFHHESLSEMFTHASVTSCAVVTSSGNSEPTADAGNDYIIPAGTPFALTGSGGDADGGDLLTYSWEQRDLGPQSTLNAADEGSIPLFRVFSPTTTETRYFPRLTAGETSSEKLPSLARSMDFRLVVRDNDAGHGGYATDDMIVTVDTSGSAFAITAPTGGESLSGSTTVTWEKGTTNDSPISTSLVDILLSTDGGATYSTMLLNDTPNDGSESVTLPDIDSVLARIMVRSEGNIFYANNSSNFSIGDTPTVYGATISSTDVPKDILDNTTITSILNVPGSFLIADVNVNIDITHTWDEDLTVTLTSPTETEVILFSGVGGGGDDFTSTKLDDEASTLISSGTPPFTGSFKPTSLLSGFDNEDAQGTWTLSVLDNFGGDFGTLNSWSIEIEGYISLSEVWVDFDYSDEELGIEANPFNTILEGLDTVQDNGTIKIKTSTSTEIVTIDQDVTLELGSGSGTVLLGGTP